MLNDSEIYKLEDIPDLYRKYLREILAFLFNYVHNEEDTKELTQDVFYKLCEQVKKGNVRKINFRAYLYKVARNHVIDSVRKKKIENEYLDENSPYCATKRESPENVLDTMMIKAVFTFIDKSLSETEASVFRLKHYQNLTLEEISNVLDVSVPSVHRIYKKVLKELGEKFPNIL